MTTTLIGGALGVGGLGVWLSGRREFLLRWLSFAALTPIVALAAWTAPVGCGVLALVIGAVGTVEYARMARLDVWLAGATMLGVALAVLLPTRLPVVVAVACVVPLLGSRGTDGWREAAAVAFAVCWLGGALGELPHLGRGVLALSAAVSIADVAAYLGGRAGRRWWPARLSTLSPNKTWAGVLSGGAAGVAVLAVLGALDARTAVAVVVGGVLGDLVESLVKRGCDVKDAGTWLPGFGGLLDRVDSLLGALLVLAVLS